MKCEIVIPIITELSVLNLIFFEKISKKNNTGYNKHTMTSGIEQSVLFPLVLNIINWTVIVKYA